jgi:hypothetical protein
MLIWLVVAMLPGAQESERLVWPVARGFVVAHHQEMAQASIEEQVPKGETVENWTRMITRIRRGPSDPMQFAIGMASSWRQACAGAKAGDPVAGPRGVDIRIDCPRNPQTGKPETMFQRTVAGEGRLYVLQVAFRSKPSAGQAAWAQAQLDRATLCRAKSKEAACR